MNNIPTSVMEDIERKAKEKYPITYGLESNGNQRLGLRIQQNAYIDALSEAWEKMGEVWDDGRRHGESGGFDKPRETAKNNFLNQIFKK